MATTRWPAPTAIGSSVAESIWRAARCDCSTTGSSRLDSRGRVRPRCRQTSSGERTAMKLKFTLLAAALAVAGPMALSGAAQAQMRPLSDPVVAHPDPESLFTSSDPKLHRNKQAALHIMRELL